MSLLQWSHTGWRAYNLQGKKQEEADRACTAESANRKLRQRKAPDIHN